MPANLAIDTTIPSATFLYSPRSSDNLKPPLSPTSSLKGCFVRSRPTSTNFDYEYSQLPAFAADPLSSSEGSETTITTPTSSIAVSLALASPTTERWARTPTKDSDARSLAPSTLTCTDRRPVVPVRIIRRSDADMDKETAKMVKEKKQLKDQNQGDENAMRSRRRTWPSYKAIRKTVSNILHRKETPTGTTAKGEKTKVSIPEPSVGRLKSSSASMFTKRRRATVSDAEKKDEKARSPVMHHAASSRGKMTSAVLEHRTQLRRSRSFSGFTNVLTAIDDAGDDDDLDELTTEARGVVLDIRRRWNFEEVPEDAALMFERCIE